MTARRFPPPWTVVELTDSKRVKRKFVMARLRKQFFRSSDAFRGSVGVSQTNVLKVLFCQPKPRIGHPYQDAPALVIVEV
jgi:hypothetical protein